MNSARGSEDVNRALIVANTEKSIAYFSQMLAAISCENIVCVSSCGAARRTLLSQDFDLCIINAPLSDETGENLSRHIGAKGLCQVILAVKSEYCDEVAAHVEDVGVITVPKPLNKSMLWSSLKLAKAAHNSKQTLLAENAKMRERIEDIRIVDRAKCMLIAYLGLSEPQAHKYIERHAMDLRVSRRTVAEGILKTYENT